MDIKKNSYIKVEKTIIQTYRIGVIIGKLKILWVPPPYKMAVATKIERDYYKILGKAFLVRRVID